MANNGFTRFPRSKFLRTLQRMQDELGAWQEHYRRKAQQVDSRWSSDLLLERSYTMDHWWHELDAVARSFEEPIRWPR